MCLDEVSLGQFFHSYCTLLKDVSNHVSLFCVVLCISNQVGGLSFPITLFFLLCNYYSLSEAFVVEKGLVLNKF